MVVMLAFASVAQGANSIRATATASIVSIDNGITAVKGLVFGNIVPDVVAAGTVTIDTNGRRTKTGNLTLVTSTYRAAEFDVHHNNKHSYTITLPSGTVKIWSGSNWMYVGNFTKSVADRTPLVGELGSFTVGATLNVNANQATGVYSGTYNVHVDFQ